MLDTYKNQINYGLGLGLILQTSRFVKRHIPDSSFEPLLDLAMVIGTILVIYGLAYYAKAKGYSVWIGGLLGILSYIGFLIMALMPDKHKKPKEK